MLKSFDRVAEIYDATRAVPAEPLAAIVAGLRRALEGDALPHLLEVGVGTGRMAAPLAAAGIRVAGVDIAPAMLARLRARCPDLPAVRAESTRLPFGPAAFDGVLFVHLLHLVPDPTATLREAMRSVRQGGVLLFGRTEVPDNPWRPVNALVRALAGEIAGAPLEWGSPHGRAGRAFAGVARAAGARVAQSTLARWSERFTGRQFLDALARRVYSNSWEIPDEVLPELLRRLAPRVEALFGGLDREVASQVAFTLAEARLPG